LDPSKGYKGITCFLVEKEWGIEIAKKEQKVSHSTHKSFLIPGSTLFKQLGIRASSTCALSLDNVKVPFENLIGQEGQGYKYAIEILNEGRVGIAAQMLGLAQGAYRNSLEYAFQRKQFGKPVAKFQGMEFQYADVAVEIEAARLLTYNASRLKEEGKNFTKEAAMAKLYASKVAQEASGKAIEWCGGVGFTRETGIEKCEFSLMERLYGC
jgi:short-chain 2-methylacyl-CoA dehydrogenase